MLERHDYFKFNSFTINEFDPSYKSALSLLGSVSGRQSDKLKQAGLNLIPSVHVEAPGIAEASLILECRKIYWQDLDPSHFLDPSIEQNYPQKDYHRMYFGEIVHITAT